MVNFEVRSAAEAEKEADKWQKLKEEIEAMEKIQAAFEIYEFLAGYPEVKTWGVVFEKDEYNDEGLDSGVYADYTTEEKPEMCEAGEEYEYEDLEITDIHRGLNHILERHAGDGKESGYRWDEYEASESGMLRFVADFAGKEYADRLKAGMEAKKIEEASEPAKGKSKKRKM